MNAKVMKEGSAGTSSVSLLLLDHKTGTINKEYNRADCNIYSFSVDNDEYSLLLIKFDIYVNSTLSSVYTSLGNPATGYETNDGILLLTSGSDSTVGSAFAYRRGSYWQYNNVSSSMRGTQDPCHFSTHQAGSNYQWSATIEYDISIYSF